MSKLISLTFEHKGEVITLTPEGAVTPPEPEGIAYATDGWSVESHHGCVRNKAIDQHVAMLAAGDEFQKKVALKALQWFSVYVPGRVCGDEESLLKNLNYQQDKGSPTFTSGYTGKMMFEQFYPDVKRDPADTKPPYTYIYGDELERFTTPIFGFNPYTVAELVAERYIQSLERAVTSLRNAKPGAPNFRP